MKQQRKSHVGQFTTEFADVLYAEAALPTLVDPALARFEEFLALPDPELQGWLLQPERVAGLEFESLIASVRRFHGL